MAKSRGRKFAEITSPTSGVLNAASVPTITNAKLQNSAMTLAGSSVSLGGTGVADTDALSEGSSNLYFTDARVQTFLGGGTLAGNIVVPDNRSIYLGSNSDFRLVHNTINTQLINATGALQVTSNGGFDVTGAATFSSTITATGTITGTLATAAQTNITSVGTLTALAMSGALTINTTNSGVPTINLYHSNASADNFRIMAGVTGVSNGGFSIYDVDATTNRFVINSSGNVGIGATNPSNKLDVIGNALIQGTTGFNATNEKANLYLGDTNSVIRAEYDVGTHIMTNNTERLTVRGTTGNVGIGTTNPQRLLQVGAYGSSNGEITIASTTTGYGSILFGDSATGTALYDGYLQYNHNDRELLLAAAAVVGAKINSNGDFGIGLLGGTSNPISARLDVVGGGTSTYPTLELVSNTSNVFNHAVNAFNGSLTAGENNIFIIGKEGSTKNSGYIGYKWNGAASNTNLVTFGHWSSDNLMNLSADGRLGIGTQIPASYDTDSAGVSADLVVVNSGHAGIVVASGVNSDAGIFFGDGTTSNAYRGAVSYVNSQERLYFKASGQNKLTLDSTKLNAMGINLDVGVDTATVNFTDSVSNGNTKYIEIGANGSSSLGDALLVTHSSGSGVGYFGYESGNDRLIIACDNGGGNNTIEFSVNAGTATGGSTDNLNGATAALTVGGDEVVTTAKHVRQSGAPGFKVKSHAFTKGVGWTHIGASITTVDYNNNSSGWSSSNGRFTPTRAGYYLFCFGGWANASTNGARYATSFAKNNSLTYISGGDYCSVDSPLNGHSEVIYMNGSTDYVQLYAYSAISCTWGTNSHAAWWSAVWLH